MRRGKKRIEVVTLPKADPVEKTYEVPQKIPVEVPVMVPMVLDPKKVEK